MLYYEKMKEIRIDADETQAQAAEALHTSQVQYYKYEAGLQKMPTDRLLLFCQHYNVSSDYVLDLPKTMKWPR